MAQDIRVTLPQVVSQRLLMVADYQRPYAWELKQLSDLWDDLDLLGSGVHYAGTVVMKEVVGSEKETIDGERLTTYEVVDGQQRLTTCLLLLDRLRRRLAPFGDAGSEGAARAASRLRQDFGKVLIGGVEQPRLRLGADLESFWENCVLGDEAILDLHLTAGKRRLLDAVEFFDTKLDELTDGHASEEAVRRLLDLRSRVTSGLKLLIYQVESDAEVGVIFETLNERGKPLSELEKVKNYLLYLARQLPHEQQADLAVIINSSWTDIFDRLSRLRSMNEERLLRAHWLATQDPDSRRWKRVGSIKEKFLRSKYVPESARLGHRTTMDSEDPAATPVIRNELWDELYTDVMEYVKSLRACATFLAEIYDPEAGYHAFSSDRDRARRATAALRRSSVVALFLPLLFGCRLGHPSNGAAYANLVELCEKYSARVFAIAQRRSNAGEPYLCKIAHRIAQGEEVGPQLAEIVGILWGYAPDDRVSEALAATDNWYSRQAHKYLLYEYELSKVKSSNDVKPWSEFNDTGSRKTTEHILPQNPAEGSDWWNCFSPEEHEQYRHTLGNLVLTYDNSVYSNREYAAKRGSLTSNNPCYYLATLAQEREVAEWESWTPESIRARQARLVKWAMKRWAVDKPGTAELHAADTEMADEVESVELADDFEDDQDAPA